MKKYEKAYPVYHPDLTDNLYVIAEKLLNAKENGTGLYCDMEGLAIMSIPGGTSKTLVICSDDINTIDDVFIKITGMTEKEYQANLSNKAQESRKKQEDNKLRLEEQDKEIVKLLPEILERGKRYIYPNLDAEWEMFVNNSSKDENGRALLYGVYDVLKALAEGKDIHECKEMFLANGYSGAMINPVKNIIFKYSFRGAEFYKAVSSPKDLLLNLKKVLAKAKEDKKIVAEQERRRTK